MKKTLSLCIISFILFAVVGCGAKDDATLSQDDTIESATETTIPVTETSTETEPETTIATTTTTTAARKSLDDLTEVNEYDESKNNSYTLLTLDFSIPQYWKLNKTEENRISFYSQPKDCERAVLIINCANGTGTASEFESAKDKLQQTILDNQTDLSDIENISKSVDGEVGDGIPYRSFAFDGKTEKNKEYRKTVTLIYEESVEKVFVVTLYQPYDTKYNYFSDYASVLFGIKRSKPIEVSIDGVRIGQDSQGRKIAIVDMTYTNTASSNQTFFTNYDCRVYQNKVELDSALFIDGVDYSGFSKSVQPGGALSLSEAFTLNDSSEIIVEVTNLLGTKTILSQKYSIN